MSTERPCTWDEQELFAATAKLLRDSFPIVVKRGRLESIRIATTGTVIFRASSGRLQAQDELDILSPDTWWARSKSKPRDPTKAEMSRWRQVSAILESGAPEMRGPKLIRLHVRHGELVIGPDGALNAIIDAEATETAVASDLVYGTHIEAEPAILEPRDDIDHGLEAYRMEMEKLQPFVAAAATEEPTIEWKPPAIKRRMVRPSDLPNARRITRGSKARCPMPRCHRALPGNQSIPLATMKGGKVVDLAGRHTQKALLAAQLEIVMPPRSFVGSADALGIDMERAPAPPIPVVGLPTVPATSLDPAALRAHKAAEEAHERAALRIES